MSYCDTQRKVIHFQKDPDSVLNFTFDWTEWLFSREESTIFSSEINVTKGDLVIENTLVGTQKVTVKVSGGSVPRVCYITCRITTNIGEIEERSMLIEVIER